MIHRRLAFSIQRAPVLILTLVSTQIRYLTSFASRNMDKLGANGGISFVDAEMARNIDERLMSQPGFSIDQLMELAGYSVASAANDFFISFPPSAQHRRKVAVYCGPGNNGGDGLVAARHLRHFGHLPMVIYPKKSKGQLFDNLVRQCEDLDISVTETSPLLEDLDQFDLIIDGLFGFSFKGPAREPFSSMLEMFTTTKTPTLSIDLPSGWDVNEGDIHGTGFLPSAVISLTLPKRCMVDYQGRHYVGGRFMPPKLAAELGLRMPDYGPSSSQVLLIAYATRLSETESVFTVCRFYFSAKEHCKLQLSNIRYNCIRKCYKCKLYLCLLIRSQQFFPRHHQRKKLPILPII